MDVFERLRSAAADDWKSYVDHDFVRQLSAGTLPQAAFRIYLVQDYLFLIQFARAYALAAYKSHTLADIRAAQTGLAAILDGTALHVGLCPLGPRTGCARGHTRAACDGGLHALRAGLRCRGRPARPPRRVGAMVIGYAEIGRALAPHGMEALGDHTYREWIAEYASEPYQAVAEEARLQLEALATVP